MTDIRDEWKIGALVASALMAANYGGDSGEDVDRLLTALAARGLTVVREGELDVEGLARAMHDSVWSGHWLHDFEVECPDGQTDADEWRRKAAMTAAEYARLSRQPEGQ